jgi:hypothetical protein
LYEYKAVNLNTRSYLANGIVYPTKVNLWYKKTTHQPQLMGGFGF